MLIIARAAHVPVEHQIVDQADYTAKRNFIWISGYPKSGNTWICAVLEAAGKKYGFPQRQYDAYLIESSGKIPPICPAVSEPFSRQPCSVLKTHSLYSRAGQPHYAHYPGLDATTVGYVHIYRNPLDVLLSYVNYTRLEYAGNVDNAQYRHELFVDLLGFAKPIEYSDWVGVGIDSIPTRHLDHALDHFSQNGLSLARLKSTAGTWSEHVRSWFAASSDMPGYSIRYEDCLQFPEQVTQLASMFTFSQERLEAALRFVNKRTRRRAVSGDHRSRVFFNKMDSYYFAKYFSSAAVRRFCYANEAVLKEFGYESLMEKV